VRAAWWLLWRSRLLSPLCVTARKPGAAEGGGPGEPLAALVRRDLAATGSNGATPSVSCVLLTGGRSVANKVVALAFAGDEPTPRMAVKLARVPEAEAPLRREVIVLRELFAEGLQAIPRVLAEHDLGGGRMAVCESVVAGRPLADTLRTGTYPRLASRVASLLADLATRRPRLTAEWWTWIAEPSLDALEGSERAQALELLRGLGDLPEVPEHRDCSPWNVIVQADGAAALVDWESSEPAGLPGLDLVYFLSFASFFVDRTMGTGREPASYAAMLDRRTFTGQVYRQSTEEYSRRVGVTPDQLGRLRLLCWLVHARAAQVQGDASAAGAPLFLALARSELRRRA
jgi:Phosphotransferase enzyme family